MKKRILLFVAIMVMLICVFAVCASAAEPDTTKETVTLADGTVCALWDTDGNPLMWYVVSTDEETKVKTYAYVDATSEAVAYINSSNSTNQLDNITITVDGTEYAKTTIAVANFPNAKITAISGNGRDARIGEAATRLYKTFQGCSNLEYAYVNSATTSVGQETFKNCSSLKFVNIADLTELTAIGIQTFNSCGSLFDGIALDLTNTKLKELGNLAFRTAKFVSVKVPEATFTTIGNEVFSECSKLETVTGTKAAFEGITSIGNNAFKKCSKLVQIDGLMENGILIIPEGITSIGQQAFDSCNTFKYLSLPTTIKTIGSQAFTNCKGLIFVDFNDNTNTITFENYGHFAGCTSLKAISFSDNIASLQNRILQGCTSLEAVYLPANMPKMGTNGNGQGPFDGNTKMYFVQEPFEVRDANGNFYGDSFKMPTKPPVYYMPSTLTTLIGHVRVEFGGTGGGGSSAGSYFQNCTSINDVIVFGEGFNYIGAQNIFSGMGTQDSPKTVVFLGDIKGAVTLQNAKYVSLVFANDNDKTPSDLGFVYVASNTSNDESYMYFCSEGTKYNYHTSKSEIKDATAIKEYIEGLEKINEAKHVAKPELTVETDPDCVTNTLITTYCFCGAEMGTSEVEGTKLGHNHDLEKGAILVGIAYADFAKAGNKIVKCERCEVTDNTQAVVAIFSVAKFSLKDDNSAICVSYTINNEAYNAFLEANEGASLEFGLVAAASKTEEIVDPLNGANISHDLTKGGYSAVDLKLTGDWATQNGVFISMALYTSYKTDAEAEATVSYVTKDGSSTACEAITYQALYDYYYPAVAE